jgi:hypothetical protein
MDLTASEAQVIARLRTVRVAQLRQLAAQLELSSKTVQRALLKAGYFTSINHNARFVTLKEVPQFDRLGLWSFKEVHFSKHGNLRQTLVKVIEDSPAGCTLLELEGYVGTRAHNHVSQLIREGKAQRFFWSRNAVYVSAHPERAKQQESRRRTAEPAAPAAATAKASTLLPPGFDFASVIRVLVRLLETPDASLASVARSLQARQVSIRADQIRDILDFYGLKKTTRGS